MQVQAEIPKFSIVILNWNSFNFLPKCINSILTQSYFPHEIIVIDNGSEDNSVEYIKTNFPDIKIIINSKNLGYSAGNNIGIRKSTGNWIVVLNADTEIDPDFLTNISGNIKTNEKVGSISGKILRDREGTIDSTGIVLNKRRLSPYDRGENEKDQGQFDKAEYIFGPSGAAAVYKRDALEDAAINEEYFDESFFAYYEDVDLAWRLQWRGWKSWYCPDAKVYHFRQGPFVKNRKIFRRAFANRYLIYVKNECWRNFYKFIPFNIPYEIGRCIKLFLKEPYQIGAIGSFLERLPGCLKKRKWIKANRKVKPEELKHFE